MNRLAINLVALFLVALCFDCAHLTKATPSLADAPEVEESVDPFWVVDPSVVTYVKAPDNPDRATVLDATYPQLRSTQPAMQEINRIIRDFVLLEQRVFDEDFGEPDKDEPNRLPYEQRLDFWVMHYSEELVSVFGTAYEYTGGAHGNYRHYSENFWIVNGEITLVRLEDLFVPTPGRGEPPARPQRTTGEDGQAGGLSLPANPEAWHELLVRLATADLWRQKERDDIPYSLTLEQLDVFWLTGEGITFVFEPYLVGCFAEGSFAVFVPWTSLATVLRQDGPLCRVLPGLNHAHESPCAGSCPESRREVPVRNP